MRKLRLARASILLASAVAAHAGTAAPTAAPAAPALEVRTFELTYRATVSELPAGAQRLNLWIPYPHSDENQSVEVVGVEASVPYEVTTEPEFGNRILHLSVERPRQAVAVVLRARVERQEVRRKDFARTRSHGEPQRSEDLAKWLEADRLVPLDERIRGLAAMVTEGKASDLDKARAIYDYVVDTMSYDKSGSGWGNGDIYWACDMKRGNCTDFHALFTGLARASGIPAKFAIGLPLPSERGDGTIPGYHCWAEFWLDGYGWVPVDTSEARKHPERRDYYFGAHDPDRVELTEGRDLVLQPGQEGPPLNFFVYPYAEVDGKPLAAIDKAFSYRDLSAADPAVAAAR